MGFENITMPASGKMVWCNGNDTYPTLMTAIIAHLGLDRSMLKQRHCLNPLWTDYKAGRPPILKTYEETTGFKSFFDWEGHKFWFHCANLQEIQMVAVLIADELNLVAPLCDSPEEYVGAEFCYGSPYAALEFQKKFEHWYEWMQLHTPATKVEGKSASGEVMWTYNAPFYAYLKYTIEGDILFDTLDSLENDAQERKQKAEKQLSSIYEFKKTEEMNFTKKREAEIEEDNKEEKKETLIDQIEEIATSCALQQYYEDFITNKKPTLQWIWEWKKEDKIDTQDSKAMDLFRYNLHQIFGDIDTRGPIIMSDAYRGDKTNISSIRVSLRNVLRQDLKFSSGQIIARYITEIEPTKRGCFERGYIAVYNSWAEATRDYKKHNCKHKYEYSTLTHEGYLTDGELAKRRDKKDDYPRY